MTEHSLNLPWRIEGCTLIDSADVPVAVTLGYTSIRRVDSDGTVYNTSEYAGPIRAEAVCKAMRAHDELVAALKAVRANLVRLAWEENSLMIEEIDAALSRAGGATP